MTVHDARGDEKGEGRGRCDKAQGDDSRHLQQLLMDQLQSIYALLQLDVLIGELGLVLSLTQLLLDHLLGARSKGREIRAISPRNGKLETCQHNASTKDVDRTPGVEGNGGGFPVAGATVHLIPRGGGPTRRRDDLHLT